MKIVYHDRFREVYSSDPAAASGRIESILEESRDYFDFDEPKKALVEDVLLVHDQSHVERVMKFSSAYETALLAVGGAEKTAETAMSGETVFGLIRPPGHHARRASSWGFCYFNNIAVAVEKLRVEGKIESALIIDIDLHYGDGTADIFSSSANVTYSHPEGSNRQAYLNELNRFLMVTRKSYDVLAVSAGFGRHEQDWGGLLTTEDYAIIGKMLRDFAESHYNGRRFAVLEGGYNHSVLGKNVRSFLDGLK